MAAEPRRGRRRPLLALAALNLVVVAAIGWVLASRGRGRDGAAPPDVRGSGASAVDWAGRFADGAGTDDPTCRDCNLLLVSLDIFRPDHLSCLGYPRDPAPNLCAMASRGTLFENFVVHAYQTPISQMSMFTGRYPSSSGFVSFGSHLAPDLPYLPESLKAAGYATTTIGSSFEVMIDMATVGVGSVKFTREGLNPGLSFGRGFDRFVFTGNRNVPTDAIPWLREHGGDRFFLWLPVGTLHWPYGAHADPAIQRLYDPPGYRGPLAAVPELSFGVLSRIYRGRYYDDRRGTSTELGPEDAAFIRGRYDAGLHTVDAFLGELLASLPAEVLRKTLIVVHGVHGEDLGEHGYFGHYDIYDTEVRSALWVLDPRHRAEGVRVVEQVEGVDLAPTLLALLGLPPLPGAEGISFAEALRTGRGDPDRVAFLERIPLWEDIFRHRTHMPADFTARVSQVLDRDVVGDTGLRTSRWKLLHRKARAIEEQVSWWSHLSGEPVRRPEWELYDLSADPTEQHDLGATDPEGVLPDLKRRLLAWEESLR